MQLYNATSKLLSIHHKLFLLQLPHFQAIKSQANRFRSLTRYQSLLKSIELWHKRLLNKCKVWNQGACIKAMKAFKQSIGPPPTEIKGYSHNCMWHVPNPFCTHFPLVHAPYGSLLPLSCPFFNSFWKILILSLFASLWYFFQNLHKLLIIAWLGQI